MLRGSLLSRCLFQLGTTATTTATTMRHPTPVFLLTALFSAGPLYMTAQEQQTSSPCPVYGCHMTPQDVHYNTKAVKQVLEQIRDVKRDQVSPQQEEMLGATKDAVTLTLIGYKGGDLNDQINQDRSVIVAPFTIFQNNTDDDDDHPAHNNRANPNNILLGVFDGHARNGEAVSEHAATELPRLLAEKLKHALLTCATEEQITQTTVEALKETFIELDRTAPAQESGGCTASVVYRQGSKIYVANTGDSRSFVVTYRPSTGVVRLVYISREDKPDVPEEQERVEAAGGQVYIPAVGTSRVVYQDPGTGAPVGLAMSRSIGDWIAGKIGVIPDPLVEVIDIDQTVTTELYGMEVDATGNTRPNNNNNNAAVEDDVYIFAVSATDGMMDYLPATEIAKILSHSLFARESVHPVTACEHLIFAAANVWQTMKQGRYRDDIAIAVGTLRRPNEQQQQVKQ